MSYAEEQLKHLEEQESSIPEEQCMTCGAIVGKGCGVDTEEERSRFADAVAAEEDAAFDGPLAEHEDDCDCATEKCRDHYGPYPPKNPLEDAEILGVLISGMDPGEAAHWEQLLSEHMPRLDVQLEAVRAEIARTAKQLAALWVLKTNRRPAPVKLVFFETAEEAERAREHMRQQGVFEVNGRPIEEVYVYSDNPAEVVRESLAHENDGTPVTKGYSRPDVAG